MKDVSSSESGPTDQAIAWQMRLADAPDDVMLLTALRVWREACPENERAWRKAERVRNLARIAFRERVSATARRSCATEASPPLSSAAPAFRRRSAQWLWWASPAAAAVMALAIFCGPMTYDRVYERLYADDVTGAGDVRNVTLRDGTEITLGAETAIAVNDDKRQVTLLRGEALFHVTHDAARPFTVLAGSATLRDIGTIFDVRKDGPRLTLAVREGAVGLLAPRSAVAAEQRVGAGQQIMVTEGSSQVEQSAVTPDTIGSWRSGLLAVDGIAITDLLDIIGRYYAGYLIVHGTPPAPDRMGGIYDLRHPAESLRMLASSHGGAVSEFGNRLMVVTFEGGKGRN